MENKEKVTSFEDLIVMGCVSKVVEIGTHKIKIRTLNAETQGMLLEVIPSDGSEIKKMDLFQRMLISHAIESIDGECLTQEENLNILNKGQAQLTNILFSEYEKLVEEQNHIFEGVKKNTSQIKKIP